MVARYDYGFSDIPNKFVKGPAVSVKAGNFYDMEILVGEQPGVGFFADLLIEKAGATYEKESHGSPILPIFRVAEGKMPPSIRAKTAAVSGKGPGLAGRVVKPEKK